MTEETIDISPSGDKKVYNPDDIKTVVDVLDQNALMRILVDELPSYTGNKMLKASKLGINSLESLKCLDALNRIDLSYNKLKSVRSLENLKGLTYINLSYNLLSGKGIRGILLHSKVVFLNLGYNRISILPDVAFVEMKQMKCLLLNNNKLENVLFIRELSELNTLVLSNNLITSLPDNVFEHCTNLRKFGHNQLREFPNIFHITSLKEVNLNSNKISSIPDSITQLVHLGQLDLGNNLIENVDSLKILVNLPTLSKLNVALNDFYHCEVGDKIVIEVMNNRIQTMLPQLVTLNNRLLALGQEKRENRKKHYEERQVLEEERRNRFSEKKEFIGSEKGQSDRATPVKSVPVKSVPVRLTPALNIKEVAKELEKSGVVSVEEAYNLRKSKTKKEDLDAFFKGDEVVQEEVGGWDD